VPSLAVNERHGAVVQRFTHGSPDDHNDTPAPSHSLSPGKFGCSTFAYPVPCSYKLGVHISLFRPYWPSSPSGIMPRSQDIATADVGTPPIGNWFSSDQDISKTIAPLGDRGGNTLCGRHLSAC
jgi:hypothetical protein